LARQQPVAVGNTAFEISEMRIRGGARNRNPPYLIKTIGTTWAQKKICVAA
jgi:hypothetical protein